MSRCNGCELELRRKGGLASFVSTSAHGTHINKVNFANLVTGGVLSKGSIVHEFKLDEQGVSYYLNGNFIGAERVGLDSIDQIIVRGLIKGKSYLYQISATSH